MTCGQDRTQCTNADYIKGRTVLNKMALNFISAQQKEEAERSGKPAPSKPMLMARLSNVENLIQAMTGYFSSKKMTVAVRQPRVLRAVQCSDPCPIGPISVVLPHAQLCRHRL